MKRRLNRTTLALLLILLLAAPLWAQRIEYGDAEQIYHVNPIVGGNSAERRLQQLIFNGLLQVRRMNIGGAYDLVYIPMLAQQYNFDPYNNEWVFRIRRDVEFHDGTRLSADDAYSTLRRLIDADTEVSDTFYRDYIDEVYTEGDTLRIILKREPFDVLKLFTFSVCSDRQLSSIRGELNQNDIGNDWWDLDVNSRPVGTGPFQLRRDINPRRGLEDVELVRFNDYFDLETSPNRTSRDLVEEFVYVSYATSGLNIQQIVDDLDTGGRGINFGAQSFSFEGRDDISTIPYGNDEVYYIGFNYRPERRIHVLEPPRRGSSRNYVPLPDLRLSDILTSTDIVAGEQVGYLFRRYIWQGINRLGLLQTAELRAALDADTAEGRELERRLQQSLFPAGSPFAERETVAEVGEELIPAYNPNRMFDLLNNIFDRYLREQGKPSFRFRSPNELRDVLDRTRVDATYGLFSLADNQNRILSLRMIYKTTDRMFIDYERVAKFLIDEFAAMGIHLRIDGIAPSAFREEIEKGDWDLVIASYPVPGDYDVSGPFSRPRNNELNVMRYTNMAIERVVEDIENSAVQVEYADNLEELNRAVLESLPAVLLFSMPYQAAYRNEDVITPISEMRILSHPEFLFDRTEQWEVR